MLAALLTLLPMAATAQYIPLWRSAAGGHLDVNLDRVWNYNLNEQSRWGAGLRWVLAPRKVDNSRISFEVYAGYGILDRQWKWGVGNEIAFGRSRYGLTQYILIARDYQAAGSRSLGAGSYSDPASLAAFMSRRMSDMATIVWGYRWRVRGTEHQIDGRVAVGGRLFDNQGLLYRCAGDTIIEENHFVVRWKLQLPQGLTTQVEVGGVMPQGKIISRGMAEYQRTERFKSVDLQTHVQAGITPPGTPYTHMFDLGGTWGAPFSFRNTLLTARPNEFTANTFLLLTLRLSLRRPFYHGWNRTLQIGTAPRPFVGLNAAWGHLWGQNPDGQLQHEGLDLQAPLWGIAEPIVGIEGLLRWGIADWGVAVAYRCTPAVAPYHHASAADNLALLITATLIFQ